MAKKVVKKASRGRTKPRVVKKTKDPSELLASAVADGIREKKGTDIVVMDLRGINTSVCDFFIICQGNSRTQVEAIADAIEEEVKKETGEKPWHSEGHENAEWILLDYGSVVAHVFQPEPRAFYNLESLWADAGISHIKN
ncbi:MAG: ribosome silencing factor [Bacteroidia bacterium]|nr:ribosome silencing factor [Bacteroidia bacterium]